MDKPAYVINTDGVVDKDDQYLLIERGSDEEHASGELAFPGGTVEAEPFEQEVLTDTVRREVLEEVGITITDINFIYSNTFEINDDTLCLNVVMLCSYAGGNAHVRDEDEVAAVHWKTYDEIVADDDVPQFTQRFADIAEEARTQD
jgi:8-oxo-dGTP diphosphatase